MNQNNARYIPKNRIRAVMERDDNKCAFCGSSDKLAVDHIYPIVLGGDSSMDNLQVLCRACNSYKGDNTVHEYEDVQFMRGVISTLLSYIGRETYSRDKMRKFTSLWWVRDERLHDLLQPTYYRTMYRPDCEQHPF